MRLRVVTPEGELINMEFEKLEMKGKSIIISIESDKDRGKYLRCFGGLTQSIPYQEGTMIELLPQSSRYTYTIINN